MSSSRPLAVIAVSDGPVGIDIERIASTGLVNDVAIALHPEEREAIEAVAGRRRSELFTSIWTRKEAVLKATGQGIVDGLERFSVLDASVAAGIGPRWHVVNVETDQGYMAAVCFPELGATA